MSRTMSLLGHLYVTALLGASLPGCVSTGAMRRHLSTLYTCPEDRVTVTRIGPPKFIPAVPPLEIADDPARFGQWQQAQAEKARERANGTFYLATVCGHSMVMSCAPSLDEDGDPACVTLDSRDAGKSALDGSAPLAPTESAAP